MEEEEIKARVGCLSGKPEEGMGPAVAHICKPNDMEG